MKKIVTLFCAATLLSLVGCAKFQNQIAADGGLVGSYKGDYVIRNDSGGRIMDIWCLHNVIAQADEHGSGWLFVDGNGNAIHLGGDVKVIRINEPNLLQRYHEYHAEFESKSYQELYTESK